MGFRLDRGNLALEPGEQLRLRLAQLRAQLGHDAAIGGAARHRRSDRRQTLGQRRVGKLQSRGRPDSASDRPDIETEFPERIQ